MEITAIKGKVELTRRVEEHDLIIRIQKQVYVFSRIAAQCTSNRVHAASITFSHQVPITISAEVKATSYSARDISVDKRIAIEQVIAPSWLSATDLLSPVGARVSPI